MRWFEDVQVGESYDLGSEIMKETEMDAFARKYNRSYLHTDSDYMKTTKYRKIIAPGMYTFSAGWADFIDQDVFERAEIGGKRTTVEWFRAVYAGDVLTSRAKIINKEDWNDFLGNVTVEIDSVNQEGKLVVRSINELFVKKRPDFSR